MPHDGPPLTPLPRRARAPVALLVALVVLAVGLCPAHPVLAHEWELGYSAADRSPDVAAFELDPGAVPGLPGAAFFHLPCHVRAPVASGPAPSRATLPTRDRSPPVR